MSESSVFIKKLIKANVLFGGKKIKLSGVPDGFNFISDSNVLGISATNKFTLTSTPSDWIKPGSYFRISSGGGSNNGLLFKVSNIIGNDIFVDDSEPQTSSVFDFGPGLAVLDFRLWQVINDINIAKKSLSSNNTIFNVNNQTTTGLCDGSGIANNFAEHYHSLDPAPDPTEVCVSFAFGDWLNNRIVVIASGTPGPGEIGPHNQTNACMMIQVFKRIEVPSAGSFKEVFIDIIIDKSTNNIILLKAPLGIAFAGKVTIDAK